jgi:hypothetical protein
MAFVMVWSWSRQIFLRFYLNQRMDNFLRGHVAAFNTCGGVARVLLYDNLRCVVLERQGEAIRYIRDRFFAGRRWSDIDDLNAQAAAWCSGFSANRRCPEDPSLSVREAFEQERAQLIGLPDNPYPSDERLEVSVGKTPYIRFDLNDYSVPHTQVRRTLTVMASLTQVRVLAGSEVIAEHGRVYGKGEQIEDPTHLAALIDAKRAARHHRAQDRLAHAAPSSRALLREAADRGNRLSQVVSQLNRRLDDYGASALEQAIAEALANGVPHPNAVRQALERAREQRHRPPPLAIDLPNHVKARNIVVRPGSLAAYDQLDTDRSEKQEPSDDDNR